VCRREAECAATLNGQGNEGIRYDQDECIRACVSLERDAKMKARVEAQWECVKKYNTNNDCEGMRKECWRDNLDATASAATE
jgi:hypothetical protein